MLKLFDYIYYRIYVFFLIKRDNVPETTGWMLLSLLQFFSLLTIATFLTFIVNVDSFSKYYALLIIIPLMALNWYRYERDFEIKSFDEQWKNEKPSDKKMKGYLIAAYTAFVVLFPMVIGYLRHNLGLID